MRQWQDVLEAKVLASQPWKASQALQWQPFLLALAPRGIRGDHAL